MCLVEQSEGYEWFTDSTTVIILKATYPFPRILIASKMSQQENSVKKMINVLKRSRTRKKSDHFVIYGGEIFKSRDWN